MGWKKGYSVEGGGVKGGTPSRAEKGILERGKRGGTLLYIY